MRPLALLVLLVSASFAQAQRVQGTYHPDSKTSVTWSINEHSTLIWDGKPYLPVGTIVDSPASIEQAASAGINDYVVDLPASGAGWEATISALEKHHSRFLLRVNSLAPMATGVAVEPQGYRFTGITSARTIRASLPGVQSALVVVALRRDGSIPKFERVPVVNGILEYTVEAPEGLERVALIYPITTSAELPDYWEALDKHRDALLQSLRRHAPGPGLRGIVDPFGRTLVLPGKELRFVPTSASFRDELRNYLADTYKSVETAQRTWAMVSNDIRDFDGMSRLVPLWSGTRGVSQLWDPQTDHLYPCDNRRSKIWADITAIVESAGVRRYARIVKDIHDTVDVPVVQQWAGWAAAYENPQPPLDGIAMRTVGTAPSAVSETAGRTVSSILRWKRPGWLPATEVDLGPNGDPSQLPGVIEDVSGIGARGIFVRGDTPQLLKAIAAASATPPDPSLVDSSPHAVFFPENALNPAEIQRLPGGAWWLPSPMDGDRVDMGTQFSAYRYTENGKKTFAISAVKPGKYKFLMAQPKQATISTLDGSAPQTKVDKNSIEITMGGTPIIVTGSDEIPVPEEAYKETHTRFIELAGILDRAHQDAPAELYEYQEAFGNFKTAPGASFVKMRHALQTLSAQMGRFTWIEAETSRDHNFSEIDQSPACSAGGALSLRTQLSPGPEGFYANYTVPVKSAADQEVWVAARIPSDRRADFQVIIGGQLEPQGNSQSMIGGQTLTISTEPISLYANGFGWYKLGVTRLAGATSNIKVLVNGDTPSDMAVDVILLTPSPFHPNGITGPDPIDFSKKPAIPGKKPGQKRGPGGGAN